MALDYATWCTNTLKQAQTDLCDAKTEIIAQDFIISELKSLLTYYTPPDCQREMLGAVSKIEHESKPKP